tara:strand:- start:729 stop:1040 length:312 start_codon:yes stop_codon:yes gene_type:complete
MCLNQGIFRSLVSRTGEFSNLAGAGTAPTSPDTVPGEQVPQGDGYRGRRYWRRRRRETAGDYWDSRRNRDRAWEKQPDPKEDLRIPEPDINDPNPTPSGGINY